METTTNITDRDIATLRRDALEHGDCGQIAICDLAIDGAIDMDDYTGVDPGLARRLRAMTQDAARAECARVIAAGRG